ncbi:MAG: serine hydrolase [Alphaproteobacteria bacterium]|nr:serine hydrolase [Alphaproteobacteria bacterium]
MTRVLIRAAIGVAALVSVSGASLAADAETASLAAGYKAAFTCSAHFNAGRSVEQIAGDELSRIDPKLQPIVDALPDAVIDEGAKTVAVRYDDRLPARVAAWRPHLGCAQLPSGADPARVAGLPQANVRMTRDLPRPLPQAIIDVPDLAVAIDAAFDGATFGDGTETTAVLVLKDGEIVAEKYRDGFGPEVSQRTWSVAKSVAASVIGAAVQEGMFTLEEGEDGLLRVTDKAGLDAWSAPGDPRGEITIDNLLRMASGLDSWPAGNRTEDVYFGGGRVVDHAVTNRLVAMPGVDWRYANNDTMIAIRALREKMNDDAKFHRFAFERVLHPIGMRNTFLETDWNGDFILSSQVWTTAHDLARLGLLYLNDGVWNGQRILPERWAEYVSSPHPAQPPANRASGEAYPGYGAQFWLFGDGFGLPAGAYAMLGNRGQNVMIIPERNVVIVRRGFDGPGVRFDIAGLSQAVLAALETSE